MNPDDKKKIAVIIAAVGAGILASFLTGNYIKEDVQARTAQLADEYEAKKIKPLMARMEALEQDNKRMAVQSVQAIEALKNQQLQSAAKPVESVGPPPMLSLAVKTPPGKRAITIQIDSLSAVGGLINPGDYVDVLAHLNIPNPESTSKAGQDTITAMIFQKIQVLAIGTNLQTPGQYEVQQKTANLLVTFALDPDEAGLMTFAQQNGKVQLVLRSPAETEQRMLQAATWQTLSDYVLEKQGTDISAPKSQANIEPAAEEVKPFIQIFRGGREL